jgi:DsbC/DsbD-like thiol-disulfide interchange protein
LASVQQIAYEPGMMLSRRALLQSSLATLAAPAFAQEKPWRASFLTGGFDGDVYHCGLRLNLQEGWKTYWRVPGSGGIPPDVSVTGDNIAGIELEYPLPHRYDGEEGDSIGYKNEVVFPFRLVPTNKAMPVKASMKAFLGVCDIVCIPVTFETMLDLAPHGITTPDMTVIQRWRMQVPQLAATGPVAKAEAQDSDGKVLLALTLHETVQDIFVEGNPLHYFDRPVFSRASGFAILEVRGAKSSADLRGQELRLTVETGLIGVEQRLTVV